MGKVSTPINKSPKTKVEGAESAINTPPSFGPKPDQTSTEDNPTTVDAPYISVLKGFKQLCSLSTEGQEYLDKLMAVLNSGNFKFNVETIKDAIAGEVKVIRQGSSYALLAFTETATPTNLQIDRFHDIRRSIHEEDSAAKHVMSVVVDKDSGDYAKPDRMGSHLYNAFVADREDCVINKTTYSKMKLEANTNTAQAKEFILRRSPHGISERIDWAVLIEQQQTTAQSTDIYNPYNRQAIKMPIMAIGGYTRFLMTNSYGRPNVVPVVTITNVTSDLPHQDTINVVLPIVADTIICRKAYLRPYMTFSADAPNMGYFFQDTATNELKFFKSIEEFERECAPFMQPPLLALDIVEGRANCAGYDEYYFNLTALRDSARTFFGDEIVSALDSAYNYLPQLPRCPIIRDYKNYEGKVTFNGKLCDSREVDYLNIITTYKDFNPTIQNFLRQYESPDVRFKSIASIIGDDQVVPLYRAQTILFNPAYVNTLCSAFKGTIDYVNSVTLDPQTIDVLDLFGANPQTMRFNGIGVGVNNPWRNGLRVDDHNPFRW